jgi:hypothetical protein
MNKEQIVVTKAWASSAFAVLVAVFVWGDSIGFQSSRLTGYSLFPLFGLLAFGLMWSHFITAALRMYLKVDKAVIKDYYEITSFFVILFLFAHPGILIWSLYRDGFGLPPNSYLHHYIAPGLAWAALLGTLSWLAFMAYELRRKYQQKSWWKYIAYASDAAIVAVFIHGLKLGRHTHTGWFQKVWYLYGLTLAISLIYMYYLKFNKPKNVKG